MVNLFQSMGSPVVQEDRIEADHIFEIAVYADVSNVHFVVSKEKHAHIVLDTFNKGPQLEVNLINERLEIYAEMQHKRRIFQFGSQHGKLTIYLPKDFAENYLVHATAGNIRFQDLTFREAELKTGAGDIKVRDVEGEYLIAESGAGNITIKHMTAELTAKSGAGNIKGIDCAGKLTVKSGAGNVDFQILGQDDVEMKSGAGNMHIHLPEPKNLDATLTVSAGLGNVRTDFTGGQDKSGNISKVYGNGKADLKFITGVGNINLYENRPED